MMPHRLCEWKQVSGMQALKKIGKNIFAGHTDTGSGEQIVREVFGVLSVLFPSPKWFEAGPPVVQCDTFIQGW